MKKILLLVTGMSPQIVTETLYGLAVAPTDGTPWIPDEVHVMSTADGLTQIRATLFKQGHFQRILEDYQLPPIAFDDTNTHLHPICDEQGMALADLKTPNDNELAANTICEKIRLFTADDNTELHVSIAGGRKTMGFYAGYALSLYGRNQDRLSHVLVSSEFESARDFFYPTPESRFITDRNGKSWDAKTAEVWLANIPFVRLRASLNKHALIDKAGFSDVVASINAANQPVCLTLHVKKRIIFVGDMSCKLPPRGFAFYYWFALRALNELPPYKRPCGEENRPIHDLWMLWKNDGVDKLDKKSGVFCESHFEQALNEIKKRLSAGFGHDLLQRINIENSPDGDFLPLSASRIKIVN